MEPKPEISRGPPHIADHQNGNGFRAARRTGPKRASDRPKQMYEVAERFYIQEQSKDAIAKALNMDARTVAAWLKKARDTGMVRIAIHNPADGPVPERPGDNPPTQMFLPIKPVF
ncbi:MAG: hypothetical protein ACRD22_13395, partial [Terriglobia bacterium]